jgi:hypothetical protein
MWPTSGSVRRLQGVTFFTEGDICDQQHWTDKGSAGRQYLPIPSDFFYDIPQHFVRVNFQKTLSLDWEKYIIYYYYPI